MIMLKRLNFIRNQLNTHDPMLSAQHSRDVANSIRDERIMALWKQDQEQPSVYEIVQSMKNKRQS
jgi:hypothetical protein